MSEDDFIYWQDVLDMIMGGKTSELKCPFCYTGAIDVTQRERVTRVECRHCHHFIEGRFTEEDAMRRDPPVVSKTEIKS